LTKRTRPSPSYHSGARRTCSRYRSGSTSTPSIKTSHSWSSGARASWSMAGSRSTLTVRAQTGDTWCRLGARTGRSRCCSGSRSTASARTSRSCRSGPGQGAPGIVLGQPQSLIKQWHARRQVAEAAHLIQGQAIPASQNALTVAGSPQAPILLDTPPSSAGSSSGSSQVNSPANFQQAAQQTSQQTAHLTAHLIAHLTPHLTAHLIALHSNRSSLIYR